MKNLKKSGGLLIAIGLFAASSAFAQSADVKRGQALWESNGCYLCHGTVAGGGVGPAVATDLVPYVALAQYVRHPTGEMPPFSTAVLSDADLQQIYGYLKSLPQPKNADNNPLLPKPTVMGGK